MTTEPYTAVRTECKPINYEYTVKFDRTITSPKEWQEEIETIRLAKAGDQVTVHVNTEGGSIATLTEVLHAIDKSEAHFHCILAGNAYSAGGPIMLACDSVEVGKFADLMIHSSQTGYGGSSDALKSFSDHNAKIADTLLRDCYAGFCTEEEITQALMGREFWFDAEEIVRRLELRNQWREEKYKEDAGDDLIDEVSTAMAEDLIETANSLGVSVFDLLMFITEKVGTVPDEVESTEIVDTKTEYCFQQSDEWGNSLSISSDGLYINFGEGNYLNFLIVQNLESYRIGWFKTYANILGVKYAHNISLDKLIERMDNKVKEIVAQSKK